MIQEVCSGAPAHGRTLQEILHTGHAGPHSEQLRQGVRYKGHEALVGREAAMNIKGPNPIPYPTLRTENTEYDQRQLRHWALTGPEDLGGGQ